MKKLLLLILFISCRTEAFISGGAEIVQNPGCGNGSHIYFQANGPFALMVSCEDALGKYASLLYYKSMQQPTLGAWSMDERTWRQKQWGNGVIDFAWVGGNELLVSVGIESDDPGVYWVSLNEKRSMKIFLCKV